MTEVIPFDPKTTAMAAKRGLEDQPVPQDTFLPLLDAPLDDLATYLRPDTWEARKHYLSNMMMDSITNLTKQTEIFDKGGITGPELRWVTSGLLVALHVKIGQLLDAWGATEPADRHAAALFVLSASAEHRHALAKWMPGGTTSPPEENELFGPKRGLMVFKNLSLALRPGLSECWRTETGEAPS